MMATLIADDDRGRDRRLREKRKRVLEILRNRQQLRRQHTTWDNPQAVWSAMERQPVRTQDVMRLPESQLDLIIGSAGTAERPRYLW